jgi:hypothetical protein
MEATIEGKTAAPVMALWKYKPIDEDDPKESLSNKGGNVAQRRGGRREIMNDEK